MYHFLLLTVVAGKSDAPSWKWAWVNGDGNGRGTYHPESPIAWHDSYDVISCNAAEETDEGTRFGKGFHTTYEWFFKTNKIDVDRQRIVINKKGNTAVLNGGAQWDRQEGDVKGKGWGMSGLNLWSFKQCNDAMWHTDKHMHPYGKSITGTMKPTEFRLRTRHLQGKEQGNTKLVPLRFTGPNQKEAKSVDVALAFGRGLGDGVCGQCHLIYYEENGVGNYVALFQTDARSPSIEMTGDAAKHLISDNIGDSKGSRVPLYQHVDCRALVDALETKTELQTGADVGYHPNDSEALVDKCEGYKHNSGDKDIELDQPVNQPSNPNHIKQYWEENHFNFGASQLVHV